MSSKEERIYRKLFGPPISREFNRPRFTHRLTEVERRREEWWFGSDVYPRALTVDGFEPRISSAPCCPLHPAGRLETSQVRFQGFGTVIILATTADAPDSENVVSLVTIDPEFLRLIAGCHYGVPRAFAGRGGNVCGAAMEAYTRNVLAGLAATLYRSNPLMTGGVSSGFAQFCALWEFDNGIATHFPSKEIDLRIVVA